MTPRCPDWAEPILLKIYHIEIALGNIVAGNSQFTQKIIDGDAPDPFNAEDHDYDDQQVERLFVQLCMGLAKEGHSAEAIATIINNKLTGPGQKLPYCDEKEVREAIAGLH